MNPTMNRCCNVCGHAGFADLIVTCSKCRISEEHLYCMRDFCDERPAEWYCQDCEPPKQTTQPTCDTREDLAVASTLQTSRKVNNVTRRFANPGSSSTGLNKVRPKWERNGGRVKYIPVAEVVKLPSGNTKSDQALSSRSSPVLPKTTGKLASPVKNMHSIQPVNIHKHTANTRTPTRVEMPLKKAVSTPSPSIGSGSKTKSGNFVSKSPIGKQPRDLLADLGYPRSAEAKAEKEMKKASPIPNRSSDFAPRVGVALNEAPSPLSLSADCASRIISGNYEAQANKDKQIQNIQPRNCLGEVADTKTAEAKVELVMRKASPRSKPSTVGPQKMSLGGDVYTNVEHKSSEAEKANLENLQPNEENNRVPAQDVSWKGSFKMLSVECNGGLCSGIQCCPPSRVLKKVYETSKRMPEILQFELISRASLWTNIFQDRSPDFDDVGLFFFPSEDKRCYDYFTWIEFIGKKDLVMRMCMQGVELLVFTSAHLHINFQTWNGVHFFWGLFHVEKVGRSVIENQILLGPCLPNEAWNCSSKGDDGRVVDMDIDMEAGVPVGVPDIARKRRFVEDPSQAREPVITTTGVASTNIPLSQVKDKPPATVASNSPIGPPPGFEGHLLNVKIKSEKL